jgi:hypothetical protein
MTLTKNDLKAIDGLLVKRLQPLEKKTDKNFIFIKKKFDELFDFLDNKYLQVKKEVREIQSHLHLPVSDF